MEMNNLIFIMLFSLLISYGVVVIVTDSGRTTSYLVSENSTFNATELNSAINEVMQNTSQTVNSTSGTAQAGNSATDTLTQLAGVAQNVFNSAIALFSMAAITNSFTAMLLGQSGGLIPPYALNFLYIATGAIVVIGILYYLSKVK